ncbi:calcium-transporting ATPase 10, plasma membrane-type isoform X2 [Rosa chinensis]|uniref:calcium-transporting ATPase 10, plasma membrane-type isoform X2 n=1 Tax=Rosa chinensis TaxID=74649 RepID=UPI000D09102C|nr:calcium-transporting ATPase 10, plasma membrane-type isoform X2 [Rosa chinensis]
MNHSIGLPYNPSNDLETGLKEDHVERMNRWTLAKLYLKALHRFRHTLVLKKAEEKKQAARKLLRAHTQALRAAAIFKEVADQVKGSGDYFPIEPDELARLTRSSDVDALQQYGGKEGLADLLKTDLDKGIGGDDLLKRTIKFGSNIYPPKTAMSHWTCLREALYNFTRIVLVIAFMGSVVMGILEETKKLGWHDVFSVAIAAAMFILITVLSEYIQARQFQHMIIREEIRNIKLKVIRAGRQVVVSNCDIVVGDVLPLKTGDEVPADGILIRGRSLAIDKSRVTGESKIFHKDSRNPFLRSGWKVEHGSATMLVTGVGKCTESGILRANTYSKDTENKTPLQVLLREVATFMGAVGFMGAAIVAYVVWFRDFFTGDNSNGSPEPGSTLEEVIRISTIAVAIFVVALPEMLPSAFNISRLSTMKKMKADNALVRRPAVCETMALCSDALCDKTGITLNQMTVSEAYAGEKKINFADSTSNLSPILSSLLVEGIAQNTSGSLSVLGASGSPIDRAILHWGVKLGMNFDDIMSQSPVLQVLPFSSEKKRGGVALDLTHGRVHVHWKGAAEGVLASCTRYIGANDQVLPMDDEKLTFFQKAIEDMASGGLHCVAIAYRSLELENVLINSNGQLAQWELPEDDLILLAIVGMKDDSQPGIKDSVEILQRAGIKVRLVTHDNPQTAKAIAKECSILASDGSDVTEENLIEGKVFRELSDSQREGLAEKILVMARSSPNDKLLLVQALQKRGKIVAVTGYVSNDAHALHEADIGLAMGIQRTEVVKESSDIIILDDNFATVAKCFRWGRSMHEKVLKVMQQQLTANIVAVTINCMAAVYYRYIPLNAVQFVWVNLIIFGLGPLALATESPADHLMNVPPIDRGQTLIKYIQWKRLLTQVLYQIIALLVINFQGGSLLQNYTRDHATKVKNTMIFNTFVVCQISIEFGVRKTGIVDHPWKWITANSVFLGIVGIILLIQFIIIEFLGKAFFIVRLDWKEWQFSLTLGIVELLFALLLFLKHLVQRNHN